MNSKNGLIVYKNKPKIGLLIVNFKKGGAQRFITHLINLFYDRYEFHLIILESELCYPLPSNVTVKVLRPYYPKSEFLKVLLIPIYSYKVYRYLSEENVNFCFSFLNFTNFVNCFLKVFDRKLNVVISERNFPSKTFEKGLKRLFGRFLIKNLYPIANLIVPNSKRTSQDLVINFGIPTTKIKLLYNFIDIEIIDNLKQMTQDGIESSRFRFVHIGRFVHEKNHNLLIDAFSKITFEAELYLVGDGELSNNIKEKVRVYNLDDKVFFWGNVDNPFVLLNSSDCFVLSSNTEGLPNVLLEALACGLPVISTDCLSGPREILAPETDCTFQLSRDIELADYGVLTPVDNIELMHKSMELIYRDNSLREKYKHKAVRRAMDFEKKKILTQCESIIEAYV